MSDNKNANQEPGPTNEEKEEEREEEEESENQEQPKEHYEHLVDDAILGSMKNGGEESS